MDPSYNDSFGNSGAAGGMNAEGFGGGMNMAGGMNVAGEMNVTGAGTNVTPSGIGMTGVGMNAATSGIGMTGAGMNAATSGIGMAGAGMNTGVGMNNMAGGNMNMVAGGMGVNGAGTNMATDGVNMVGTGTNMTGGVGMVNTMGATSTIGVDSGMASSYNSGDVVIGGDSNKKNKKLMIILAVLGGLVVVGGIALWIVFGTSGGEGLYTSTKYSDMDSVEGLLDAFYDDNDIDWEDYYKVEQSRIEDGLRNVETDDERLNLQLREDTLEMINVYRDFYFHYTADEIVNSYLKDGEASSKEQFEEIIGRMNRNTSFYASKYYDYEEEKYDLAIEAAKILEEAGCYDETKSAVFDCELPDEASNKLNQLIEKMDEIRWDISSVMGSSIDYYIELVQAGGIQ